MARHVVAYDLRRPAQDYPRLIEAIKKYRHCHIQGSVWIISSGNTAHQVRDDLKKYVDADDNLFVATINDWAGWIETTVGDCIRGLS